MMLVRRFLNQSRRASSDKFSVSNRIETGSGRCQLSEATSYHNRGRVASQPQCEIISLRVGHRCVLLPRYIVFFDGFRKIRKPHHLLIEHTEGWEQPPDQGLTLRIRDEHSYLHRTNSVERFEGACRLQILGNGVSGETLNGVPEMPPKEDQSK